MKNRRHYENRKESAMNVKSKLLLLFVSVCTLFAVGQQACYGTDRFRQEQQQLSREFIELKSRPEVSPNIQREILQKTIEPIRQPAERLSPSFIKIREKVNQLSRSEEIRPEEIAALRTDLNEAIENTRSENERAEYEKIGEKLEIVQSIAELKERERRLSEMVEKSQENFNQLGEQEAKVSLWKNIFSGGFTVIANMVALLGFVTKMPGAKLERQLKQLQILEKKAQLKKDGIEIGNYL
jgi:isoleucyl-tRNA synthetase